MPELRKDRFRGTDPILENLHPNRLPNDRPDRSTLGSGSPPEDFVFELRKTGVHPVM